MIKDGTEVFCWKRDSLPGKNMRLGVSRLLKLCVLGEFYARFSQDAQVNETLLSIAAFSSYKEKNKVGVWVHVFMSVCSGVGGG